MLFSILLGVLFLILACDALPFSLLRLLSLLPDGILLELLLSEGKEVMVCLRLLILLCCVRFAFEFWRLVSFG